MVLNSTKPIEIILYSGLLIFNFNRDVDHSSKTQEIPSQVSSSLNTSKLSCMIIHSAVE